MARKKLETIIEIIEEIIAPSSLNESEKLKLKSLVKEYGHASVVESIPAAQQYLDEDKSEKSVHNFISKLGGILHNKSLSPIEQEINHVNSAGKLAVKNWNAKTANILLHDYVTALKNSLDW